MYKLALFVVVMAAACWTRASPPPQQPQPQPQPPPQQPQQPQPVASTDVGGATYSRTTSDSAPSLLGSPGFLGAYYPSLTSTGDLSSGVDDSAIYSGLGIETGETTGAGSGWGTIGLGTGGHGTGGHGTGGHVGSPTVSMSQPDSSAGLDKAVIRRYMKRNLEKILFCYESALRSSPELRGTVKVDFTIGADGLVAVATASGLSASADTCIAGIVKAIEFPKPSTGAAINVICPLQFRPYDR